MFSVSKKLPIPLMKNSIPGFTNSLYFFRSKREFSESRNSRVLSIFRELARKYNIEMTLLSGGRVIRLVSQDKDKTTKFIYGCEFDVNSAASTKNCLDKAATSKILEQAGIPEIGHELFFKNSNWSEINAFAQKHHYNLVCKPKAGGGGYGVIRVRSKEELQSAIQELCKSYEDFCLSPYIHFKDEYRVFVLDGEVEFVFKKNRLSLLGDGNSSVQKLLADYIAKNPSWIVGLLEKFDFSQFDLEAVPKKGELIPLKWKHNSLGTTSEILERKRVFSNFETPFLIDDPVCKITTTAIAAAKAVGICFSAVDIATTSRGYLVVEINSAPGVAHLLSEHGKPAERLISSMYDKIFRKMFDIT